MKHSPHVIKALRVHAGLNVTDMSRATGLSRQAIYDIESGRVTPWARSVRAIADALSVDVDVIKDTDLGDGDCRRRVVHGMHRAGMPINQIARVLQIRNTEIARDINQAPVS